MTLKEAVARIEELERRVRDLEARPVFMPVPYPMMPAPPTWWQFPIYQPPVIGTPQIQPYTITCQQGWQ
jgi:hypothetical protein